METKFILFLFTFHVLKTDAKYDIALCKVKENLAKKLSISTKSGINFKSFAEESGLFVDKTLLIEGILSGTDGIRLLTYPRLFGKSINLKMVETFLELQVDENGNEILPITETENYKFFVEGIIPSSVAFGGYFLHLEKPFLIANRTKIVDEYLGRYPTISLNLLPLEKPDMTSFAIDMKEVIEDAFRPHSYMMNVFSRQINDSSLSQAKRSKAQFCYDKFEQLWRGNANLTEIQTGINFLSEVLHDHFNKPVYIFLDEYDFPMNTYYLTNYNSTSTNRDIPKILAYLKDFMASTFQQNKYLKSALIVGVMAIMKKEIGLMMGLHQVIDLNMFDDPINQFFGFIPEEVKLLMDAKPEIPESQWNEALRYYDGYKVRAGGGEALKIYNTWSIVQFVNKKKKDNYWTNTCALDSYLTSFLRNNNFKTRVRFLVANNSIIVNLDHVFFSIDDYKVISRILEKPRRRKITDFNFGVTEDYGPEDEIGELMFSLLYTTGYLTLGNTTTVQSPWFLMRIPNEEVYRIYSTIVNKQIAEEMVV